MDFTLERHMLHSNTLVHRSFLHWPDDPACTAKSHWTQPDDPAPEPETHCLCPDDPDLELSGLFFCLKIKEF